MYDKEEKIWLEQELFSYKDNLYDTHSTLYLNLITSSNKKFDKFLPLKISLVIFNPNSKININLTYEYVSKFLAICKQCLSKLKQENSKDLSYQLKLEYQRCINMKTITSGEQTRIVLALINDTKELAIIISPIILISISRLLENYISNFVTITSTNFMTQVLITNIIELKELVKLQPSCIERAIDQNLNEMLNEKSKFLDRKDDYEKSIYNDFDGFMKDNENSIEIELPKEKTDLNYIDKGSIDKEIFVNGSFIDNVLSNNSKNIESLCSMLVLSDNPILDIVKLFGEKINILDSSTKMLSDFDKFLPSISELDMKCITYISRVCYFKYMQLFIQGNKKIAQKLISSFYIPDQKFIKDFNINIAFDLLILLSYVKNLSSKLSNVEGNDTHNRNLLYSQMRLFFDPFIVSFLIHLDKSKTHTILEQRIKEYLNKGVFNEYKQLCDKYKIQYVKDFEILSFCDKILSMVINNNNDSTWRLDNTTDFKLKSKDVFTLSSEQIIREVCKIEAGIDTSNIKITLPKNILSVYDISLPDTSTIETTLGRYLRNNADEVPEQFRNDFLTVINNEFKDKSYDFDKYKDKFPITNFGDKVILALYYWNPEDPDIGKKITSQYNSFLEYLDSYKSSLDNMGAIRARIKDRFSVVTEKLDSNGINNIVTSISDLLNDF